MSGLEIDSDAAHDAAQRELTKPIYPKPSLTDQLWAWLDDLIYRIFSAGSSVPGGWITISLFALVVVLAACVRVRASGRARAGRGSRQQKHVKKRALGALAARLGRAVYHLLRRGEAFDEGRFFGS